MGFPCSNGCRCHHGIGSTLEIETIRGDYVFSWVVYILKNLLETIEDPQEKKMRQLDKLVDEIAQGKPMEKVLR